MVVGIALARACQLRQPWRADGLRGKAVFWGFGGLARGCCGGVEVMRLVLSEEFFL